MKSIANKQRGLSEQSTLSYNQETRDGEPEQQTTTRGLNFHGKDRPFGILPWPDPSGMTGPQNLCQDRTA